MNDGNICKSIIVRSICFLPTNRKREKTYPDIAEIITIPTVVTAATDNVLQNERIKSEAIASVDDLYVNKYLKCSKENLEASGNNGTFSRSLPFVKDDETIHKIGVKTIIQANTSQTYKKIC